MTMRHRLSCCIATQGLHGDGPVATLTHEQAKRYELEPGAVFAEAFGFTEVQHAAWLAAGGLVPCSSRTSKGKPCLCRVPGQPVDNVPEWLEACSRGGYCFAHSGHS